MNQYLTVWKAWIDGIHVWISTYYIRDMHIWLSGGGFDDVKQAAALWEWPHVSLSSQTAGTQKDIRNFESFVSA